MKKLIILLFFVFYSNIFGWQNDVVICNADNYQHGPNIISDGSGGAIIVWIDKRSGNNYDIYVQRVNSAGLTKWTQNGELICNEQQNSQISPSITSDFSGGAIIAWDDIRAGNNYNVYAQKVSASGEIKWNQNGITICNEVYNQQSPFIISDGEGGAIISWIDRRNGQYNVDIYAQKIDSIGQTKWTSNGIEICTAQGYQYEPKMVPDGSGGAIIVWKDQRNGSYDIYAQRVNSSGIIQWDTNGITVCDAVYDQLYHYIISDGEGGVLVTWVDNRNNTDYNIFAQRVDSLGNIKWENNGVLICDAPYYQYAPNIIKDIYGNSIITWWDNRNDMGDIYAQKVNSSGEIQWNQNGIVICNASNGQYVPKIISDYSNGAFIIWQDSRTGSNPDIYAQRINSAGIIQWSTNGVVICSANDYQERHEIASDGFGNVIATWEDCRSGGYSDIYAQKLFSSESLTNQSPNRPSNILPANGSIDVVLTPNLQSSDFIDPDDDNHLASQWQISNTTSDYSEPIYDSGTDYNNLTSITIPKGTLYPLTNYFWRVRYMDSYGSWSEYSIETSFETEEYSLFLSIDTVKTLPCDTINVPIIVTFPQDSSFCSCDIIINGYFDFLDFIDISVTNDTFSCLIGNSNWAYEFNETDTSLYISMYGSEDISGEGILCWLKFYVNTNSSGFIPINLNSAIFNTGEIPVFLTSGGIMIYREISASFVAKPLVGELPLTVVFYDSSEGDIESWNWSFGDSADTSYTSFTDSITHTYNSGGLYSVTLSVSSTVDSDTLEKENYIYVLTPDLGDVDMNGEIQSYDASQILKYLVGYIDLNTQQLINAEVSGNDTVTAYDASLISQYVVHLIDIFPADTGSFSVPGNGIINMVDQDISQGDSIEINMNLISGDNILSFESTILFNPEYLIFNDIIYQENTNFLTEFKVEEGICHIVGATSESNMQNGIFATLKFIVSDNFSENETVVSVYKLRWNENPVLENVASARLTKVVGTNDNYQNIPKEFTLEQNYPNPFNPTTTILYQLPKSSYVKLYVYDISGRLVYALVNEHKNAGYYSVEWNAENVSSGIYLYLIDAGEFSSVKKCLVVK